MAQAAYSRLWPKAAVPFGDPGPSAIKGATDGCDLNQGRERAKARGVKLGRKPKLTPQQKHEALARRNAGETLMEIARSYNVSFATISRLKP